MKRSGPALASALVPVSLVVTWQLSSTSSSLGLLSSPAAVLAAVPVEVGSGRLFLAAAHTIGVALAAAVISVAAGTVGGVLLGLRPQIAAWTASSVDVLRTVPALTLIPVTVLALGPTLGAEIALATYAALWPMVLNTAGAVGSVHPRQFDVARTFRLSGPTTLRTVALPAAAPLWLVGVRMSVTLAFLVAVVVEMVITPGGLGTALIRSLNAFAPERMWVYVLTCGMVGALFNIVLRRTLATAMPGHELAPSTYRVGTEFATARGLVPVALALIVWQVAGSPASLTLPPPSQWFAALAGLHADSSLLPAIGHTLTTYLGGLSAAAVIGGAAGMAIGSSRLIDRTVSPTLDFVAAIPGAAMIPVVVLILGPNPISGIVAVGTIVAWPILLSTAAVRRAIPDVRIDMSRTMGLSRPRQWRSVTFPSSVPGIVHGVQVTSGLALIVALLTDIFGSGSGMGRLLIESQQRFDAAAAWGVLLIIGVIGYLFSVGLAGATRVVNASRRRVASAR